jgi:putative ABC transport system ATP-binding protein
VCVLLGPSGSGKSTFLNLVGGLEPADGGSIRVGDTMLTDLSDRDLVEYRRKELGFVFQFYNLVPNLTALENVELAAQICHDPLDAAQVLKSVGLEDRMANFPAQLSGGEQQRVAIARALAKNPKLLLCDEPTGALDYHTGKAILKLLQDMSREKGMTVIIITHNSALTAMADRVIRVKNGMVVSETVNETPVPVEEIEW